MEPSNTIRPVRKIPISDKLWDCFDLMANEMGGDRDGLVNQALFTFARLNGYLAPGHLGAADPKQAAPEAVDAPAEEEPPPPARRAVEAAPPPPPAKHKTAPPPPPTAHREPPPFETPSRRAPPAPPAPRIVIEPPAPEGDDEARREVAERVLETADALTRDRQHRSAEDAPAPEAAEVAADAEALGLCLMAEDGKLDKVVKERFVIGRGKHCDLVINSGKVSREHAAIVKEGAEYFIEDLGSSNGTWFNKQRIRRRKIEDGDEFFICSEKVKCVFR